MGIKEENELFGTFDLYDLDELESCDLEEVFSTCNLDQTLNDELELAGFDEGW